MAKSPHLGNIGTALAGTVSKGMGFDGTVCVYVHTLIIYTAAEQNHTQHHHQVPPPVRQ